MSNKSEAVMSLFAPMSLFTPAFETISRLKVEGFRQMNELDKAAVGLRKHEAVPPQGDTGTKVALMALMCGADYTAILQGPALAHYSTGLLCKLRLLGGPHGGVWAALRLREEGYRLVGDTWMKA